MKTPNLFKFATSELSQDAFICWLIDWANPTYDVPISMKECATKFLRKCYELHGKTFPDLLEKIEIRKQYTPKGKNKGKNIEKQYKMDIVVIVNEGCDTECTILIEDKIFSKQGQNQLSGYVKALRDSGHKCVLPIYYKIVEQSGIEKVQKDGYGIISRNDMLDLLRAARNKGADNPILLDYIYHMENIDGMINSYLSKPEELWDDTYSWIGFYSFLLKKLEKAEWDYVPNRGGGFYGLWWCEKEIDGGKLYLQLEQDKLCYKLEKEDPKSGDELKTRFLEYIKLLAKEKMVEPVKIRNAATMTGARSDYLQWNENGLLNIEATLEELRKAETLLMSVEREPGTGISIF